MKKIKQNSIIASLLLLLSGCVNTNMKESYNQLGMPGYITKNVSQFNGETEISLEPAYLNDASSLFRLGLHWNTKLPKDKYLLVAEWAEAKNFEPSAPLGLNIDGDIVYLKPVDEKEYGVINKETRTLSSTVARSTFSYNRTLKQFWISRNELWQLIKAQKVIVRVELLHTYWEERLEPPQTAMSVYNEYPYAWAKAGFEKFLTEQKVN
ncbi:hypothetical protein [Vibrio ziniensis]|uniref:Lipoprotein n=1 Tax=Vibrio ziniensis TaxID=2711221 RepID=A0A6G7CGZ8_9VIBR|nr:hypothetical protein [Vibrio ziniensis]QIH41421.1 hypothetical protein G5S32_05165 [Vibrio ziniensis]